jgi:hypothetical protein
LRWRGRHTPFFSNYRPQFFFFRTTDVVGIITVSSADMVMPGDSAELAVELGQPVAITAGPAGQLLLGGLAGQAVSRLRRNAVRVRAARREAMKLVLHRRCRLQIAPSCVI